MLLNRLVEMYLAILYGPMSRNPTKMIGIVGLLLDM